jgi:Carbohydrate esterase 2 N-terminal/GDSL-like Lipase/Acylhydrolase family/Domain of unknown function (DUF5018)
MKKLSLKMRVSIIAMLIILTAVFSYSLGSCKKEEPSKSNKKDILTFVLSEQSDSAQIDNQNKKITISIKYNANLAKLKATITISDKATIQPASGDTVDFSVSPVTYTVTAEDKSTQAWKVYVTKSTEMDKKILTFSLTEQYAAAVIDDVNDSVHISINPVGNLAALSPVITTSPGTTINPSSETQEDFSKGPVNYTISATDGSSKIWVVRVKRILYSEKSIVSIALPSLVSFSLSTNLTLITMPVGTNISSLAPVFTLSPKATISPASGATVDFSQGPVTYTITAEDGTTIKYNVMATYPLITADNAYIKYTGRIDFKTITAPRFSAPGVYFRARFNGTFCDIDVNDETNLNYISVIIDDQDPVRFLMSSGRKTYRLASGLSHSEHTILICKDTEAGVGNLNFYGFRCEGLSAFADPTTHKIECYGNSITCGAKMLFGTPCDLTNNNFNWNAANSAYLSYGAVAARALNAQWQISAISGIGLIHSCCGMGNTMPTTYDRLDFNNSSSPKWDFTKYVPDVVTICLGQNDGSTIVASQDFKNAYVAFINTIRSKYSNASIFCVTSPMADSSSSPTCLFTVMKTALASIVDSVHNAGDTKVYWVTLPHDQNHGCTGQGHPSEAEHAITAGVLEKAIQNVMGW